MSTPAIAERQSVISLDREAFDEVCAGLMRQASRERPPDALIAIPTGGWFVAQSMAKAAGGDIPILSLTCRRPSSKLKPGGSVVRKMVGGLPRPIVDRLRVAEHALLTRRPASAPKEPYQFVEQELEIVERWMATAPDRPSLLIVDDAIDSGATLLQVIDAVRRYAPPDAVLRSAVITVTTDWPLVRPDHHMFHRQLCRFPWSMDAR
jgi:hypoxanthine phosphoribosyltransferase